ncbi:putative L,D-transpeptidase YnhG [Methylovirgula sp. HY1]|nr:putative L,D-transpeptidase YnhG [Methylovirgula sp. HY1]
MGLRLKRVIFGLAVSTWAVACVIAMPAAAQWHYYDGYRSYPSTQDYPAFPGGDPYAPQPRPPGSYDANPYGPDNGYGPPPDTSDRGYDPDSGAVAPPLPQPGAPAMAGEDRDAEAVDSLRTARIMPNPTGQPPGTIVVDTKTRHLYYVQKDGLAIRYGIGVGRQGFAWKGTAYVGRKAEWPRWIPPKDMLKRRPDLPTQMAGGLGNPLGARALYLFKNHKDTLFRIHGTNEPDTIGKAVSSGCIRMMNGDVIDLYRRVGIGTQVVVL